MQSNFIRKFKKFRRNPKLFFQDTKINKYFKVKAVEKSFMLSQEKSKTRLELSQKASNIKNTQLTNDKSGFDMTLKDSSMMLKPIMCFDFDFMANKLNDYHAKGVYIKPINVKLKPALCILKKDRTDFLGKFLSFVYDESLTLKYKHGKSIKSPKTVKEFSDDIISCNTVDIRLSTDRSLESDLSLFWFRLELCDETNEYITFPARNYISRRLWKHSIDNTNIFKKGISNYSDISNLSHEQEISFDVDLVFTWVNSDDQDWKSMYAEHKPDFDSDATSTSRFKSRDELKYALRSWEKYGSFINNIYIVSNCKPPAWLNLEHPNVKWVYHEEIMPETALPTFSSHSIETSLHKIKGLSNYFIYSNDDFFLLKPLTAYDFFYSNGIAKTRFEPYGNVNGTATEGEADYLNGARNSNRLLEKEFNKFTTQLHTHSPQSMRVDILNEMEEKFTNEFTKTLHNKFRAFDDVSVTGYLYHHYAVLSGNALESSDRTDLIQQNHNFTKRIDDIVKQNLSNDFNKLPLSLCLNDGNDSHLNDQWNLALDKFFDELFNIPSSYER